MKKRYQKNKCARFHIKQIHFKKIVNELNLFALPQLFDFK